MKLPILLLFAALLPAADAIAAVHKCRQPDGSTAYSQTPCADPEAAETLPKHLAPREGRNRYSGIADVFQRYRCDSIEESFGVLPGADTLPTLLTRHLADPQQALRRIERIRAADPDHYQRFVEGYAELGKLCSIRATSEDDGGGGIEFAWYSANEELIRQHPAPRIADRLRALGYVMEVDPLSSDDYQNYTFRDGSYSCSAHLHNSGGEAGVDLRCHFDPSAVARGR